MRLLEHCLITIVQQVTPRLPSTVRHSLSDLNQRNNKCLQIHCSSLVSQRITIAFSVL